MQEPSVRTSRLAIATGFGAALILAIGGFLIGRTTSPPPPTTLTAPPPSAPPLKPDPDTGRLLSRGDITDAARQAADAFASGAVPPPALRDLPGRRFELALPFGCAGPAGADSPAPLRWRYDEATQALRVHVALVAWQAEEWGLPSGTQAFPQGFWVTRPWSSADTCPAPASDAAALGTEPVTLPGQTLAIISFGPEVHVAGAGYDAVVRIAPDKRDLARGLRARVSGRIDRVPGSGAIRCVQPAGIEQQPVCAVAAVFDELIVDNPATGETLATWTIGRIRENASSARPPAN